MAKRDPFADPPTQRSKLVSELAHRRRLVRALAPLDAFPVENSASPGTADVNYRDGWVELKVVDDWPKRDATPVRIDHFTPKQRAFLMQRRLRGGRAYLYVLRPQDHRVFIFDGRWAAEHAGHVPEVAMHEFTLYAGHFSDIELLRFFVRQNEVRP